MSSLTLMTCASVRLHPAMIREIREIRVLFTMVVDSMA